MQGKIDEEKEAKDALQTEPEGAHKIALARWKELKTEDFAIKVIIEKIKMQEEVESKNETIKLWSSNREM